MRSIVGLVLGFLAPLTLLSQSFTIGGTDRDWASAVAFDEEGNLYVAYSFTGTIDLDPGPGEHMVTSELTAGGFPTIDVALASYTSRGALRWGMSYGSQGSDWVNRIVAGQGRLLIAGMINGPVYDIDPGEVLVSIDAPSRRRSALVAAFDTSGAYQWSHALGDSTRNTSGAQAWDAVLREDGASVFVGHFEGTVDPDGTDAPFAPWTSKGVQSDVWVGCWSRDGEIIWGESFGGVGADQGRAIVAASDSFYIAGTFEQVIDLDPTDAALELTSSGGLDVFLGCFTDSVRVQWGTRWGSTATNQSSIDQLFPGCLARHGDGSLTAAFTTWDTCTFGNDVRPSFVVTRGLEDIAVVHLDRTGAHLWSFTVGGDYLGDRPYALSLTDDGSILVGGSFMRTADLDPSTAVATFRALSDSNSAAFIAQYSRNGEYQWGRAFGAPNAGGDVDEYAWFRSIALDRLVSDEIIAAGQFGGTVVLGSAPGYGTVRADCEGVSDAMVLRLDPTGDVLFDALTSVDADDHTATACDIRTIEGGLEVSLKDGSAVRVAIYDILGRSIASASASHGAAVLPLTTNEPCFVVIESDHQRTTARILRY